MTEAMSSERIPLLVQFGWAVAEARGRWRQELIQLPHPSTLRPTRVDHVLPLNIERSPKELIRQAEEDVCHLLEKLAALTPALVLDVPLVALPYQSDTATGTVVDHLTMLSRRARGAKDAPDDAPHVGDPALVTRAMAWNDLAGFFYAWDTLIQDTLIGSSSEEAAAYQLGRGLAESYWALAPDVADEDARSWASLLGVTRRDALRRFLIQLTPYVEAGTISAMTASLTTWCDAARAGSVRGRPDAPHRFGTQVMVWRYLLVDRVSPSNFEDPQSTLAYAGQLGTVLRAFVWELLIGGLSAVAVIIALVVLITVKTTPVAAVLTAILGFFSITGAGILAAMKAVANASIIKMRAALNAKIAADAVTILPEEPLKKHGRLGRRAGR